MADTPKSEAIRAKSAEIIRLRKEVEAKLAQKRLFIPSKFQRLVYIPQKNEVSHPHKDRKNRNEMWGNRVFLADDDGKTMMSFGCLRQSGKITKPTSESKLKPAAPKLETGVSIKQQQLWLADNMAKTEDCDRVQIKGVTYAVMDGGERLIPLLTPSSDPSEIHWFVWKYAMHPSGTLVRVQHERPELRYRKFGTSGFLVGGNGRYIHDIKRQRVCTRFLKRSCNTNCQLSHEISEHNQPVCQFYLRGNCAAPNCGFLHQAPPLAFDPNYSVWLCRPFAKRGWCSRGAKCPFLHCFNCPDYEEYGECPEGYNCRLKHRDSKRFLARKTEKGEEEVAQINSFTVDPKLLFDSIQSGKMET